MISFIYPYRNRDLVRLENSFNSLERQTDRDFVVFLVDYGSFKDTAAAVEELCSRYSFVNYEYLPTSHQPWNKSKALNFMIRKLNTDYCFVSDVDIIYNKNFVAEVNAITDSETVVYFQVGFLDQKESSFKKEFIDFRIERKSTNEATGLSLFPVKALKSIRGFDEFYHFWGAEDTDVHVRLKNSGLKLKFYDKSLLLLHQWHPSYRSMETSKITCDLRINGIIQINQQHLKQAELRKIAKVNCENWGLVQSQEEIKKIESTAFNLHLTNEKKEIDEFLYGTLPGAKGSILKVKISLDPFCSSVKYYLKRLLGQKVPDFYDLKTINDKILLHLISYHRNDPYVFRVNSNLTSIEIGIIIKKIRC